LRRNISALQLIIVGRLTVIERKGDAEQISQIKLSTLILIGDEYVATATDKSDRMHAEITHTSLISILCASHSSTIEQPEMVTKAISVLLVAPVELCRFLGLRLLDAQVRAQCGAV
jgi:hypothetical protein